MVYHTYTSMLQHCGFWPVAAINVTLHVPQGPGVKAAFKWQLLRMLRILCQRGLVTCSSRDHAFTYSKFTHKTSIGTKMTQLEERSAWQAHAQASLLAECKCLCELLTYKPDTILYSEEPENRQACTGRSTTIRRKKTEGEAVTGARALKALAKLQ